MSALYCCCCIPLRTLRYGNVHRATVLIYTQDLYLCLITAKMSNLAQSFNFLRAAVFSLEVCWAVRVLDDTLDDSFQLCGFEEAALVLVNAVEHLRQHLLYLLFICVAHFSYALHIHR